MVMRWQAFRDEHGPRRTVGVIAAAPRPQAERVA
jgi:hypothetical protein